jgi:broad specificity phosphatase PhoE
MDEIQAGEPNSMPMTSTTLWLVMHAADAALRAGTFAQTDVHDAHSATLDTLDALDARAEADVSAWRAHWLTRLADGTPAATLTSPAALARATARAAGFDTDVRTEAALAETHYGDWSGRRLIDVAHAAPDALAAWTRDPAFRPPGGESFDAVRARVGAWLDALNTLDMPGHVVAFTHASVIRAALLHALGAPSASFRQIEIAPLSVTALRRTPGGWTWLAAQA